MRRNKKIRLVKFMSKNILSLSGNWRVDYLSSTPYTEVTEPVILDTSDSVTTLPVPGYWEDMTQQLASTQLHRKLNINPLYTDQSYPMTGYCPDMYLPNPVGCLAYEKAFVLENVPQNAELFIGGVQNIVSAWVNGVYLGRHEGYCTPFAFSIPEGMLTVGENRVTLAVSNNRLQGYQGRPVSGLTSRAANECTGGIYGDVELRSYPNSKSNHDFLGYLIYFEVPFLETDKASGMMEEVFFFTPERICHIMAERK